MLEVHAVYDKKMGIHLSPFFVKHVVEAIRSMSTIARDKNTSIGRFPEDYELRHVGNFNEETGEIFPTLTITGGAIQITTLIQDAQNGQ